MRVITWLIYSNRPLNLEPLAIASIIDPDQLYDEECKLDEDEMILDYCGSLIRFDSQSGMVRVSHYSVTQYFKARTLPDGSINPYYLDEAECHSVLLRTCLNWLSSPPFISGSNRNWAQIEERLGDELSKYAFFEWPHHARKCEVTTSGRKALQVFLRSLSFHTWAELWEILEEETNGEPRLWTRTWRFHFVNLPVTDCCPGSKLYYSALFKLPLITKELLQSGSNPDDRGGFHRYPLTAAASNSDPNIVQLLLDCNANVRVTARDGRSLLSYAVQYSWRSIVQQLESAGAEMDGRDYYGETPLLYAAKFWNEGSQPLRKLISSNTVNHRSENGSAPLHISVENARFKLTELLIACGADLNIPDNRKNTVLHYAAYFGVQYEMLPVVLTMLQNGADPGLLDQDGYSPLHWAILSENVRVAKLLAAWPDLIAVKLLLDEIAAEEMVGHTKKLVEVTVQERFRRAEALKLATRYPFDYKMQDILGTLYLRDSNSIGSLNYEMAIAAFERSIELNPINVGVATPGGIIHVRRCARCVQSIYGIGYKVYDRGVGIRYPKLSDNKMFCSICVSSAKGYSTIATPSPKWITLHFPGSDESG